MKTCLFARNDFREVYQKGRRYNGVLMTAFVLPNGLSHHRLGVTASRRMAGRAVRRNRAKRLLRETFRLKRQSLERLLTRYDWVLNAKGSLLSVKVPEPLQEFEGIIGRIANEEAAIPAVGSQLA